LVAVEATTIDCASINVTVLFVFGGIAVIFAGPIAMIFVAVKKLYVRDSLGERTVLPGEDAD
jgi:hypothetical protein